MSNCHVFVFHTLTGSVIAITGVEKNDGKFTVEDFCLADLPPQTPREPLKSDRYSAAPHGTNLSIYLFITKQRRVHINQ